MASMTDILGLNLLAPLSLRHRLNKTACMSSVWNKWMVTLEVYQPLPLLFTLLEIFKIHAKIPYYNPNSFV